MSKFTAFSPQNVIYYVLFRARSFVTTELLFGCRGTIGQSNLVDPASSHMLVSKIKPCMSKYKPIYGETANGSLNQNLFI